MQSLEYVRPKTLEGALDALQSGVAMSGGTYLTPIRGTLTRVVDLQDLDLDDISQRGPLLHVGATVTLEKFRRAVSASMPELTRACRIEAALNLRNSATLAGTIAAGDGRSALLCSLLALDPIIELAPNSREVNLPELFDLLANGAVNLIVGLSIQPPQAFAYRQIGRSPFDLPIVSVAAARSAKADYGISVGGWGTRPMALPGVASELKEGNLEAAVEVGGQIFQNAGDDWASAEYRASVGPILLRRVLKEVLA